MKNDTENSENSPPVYVLLPICVESKNDVFLSVLRSVINRTKMEDNLRHSALIAGMKVQTLKVHAEDIGDWTDMDSEPQQIRQAMMIGFWSTERFPSFGRKLCGDSWKAPQRQCVDVIGKQSMKPEEFDTFIFDKMKLRVMELRVTQSTLPRLNNFVTAPVHISKLNKVQLSKKMFSFDIGSDFDKQCWEALKSGVLNCEPPSAIDIINTNIVPCPGSEQNSLQVSVSNLKSTVRPLKNTNMESYPETNQLSVVTPNSSHIAKRPRLDCLTNITLGDRSTNMDTTTELINNLTTESLRMVLDKIQRDIDSLTQLYRPMNNSGDDSQLLFLKIITEKDGIICGLNKTLGELREENNSYKNLNTSLSVQADSNNALLSSLQKGLDANFKLYVKSETEKCALHDLIDRLKETVTTKERELETAKIEIAQINRPESVPELMNRIATLEHTVTESAEKNDELEVALSKWKTYGMAKDNELEKANELINELQTQVTSTGGDSAIISDSSNQVATLNQKLKEWSVYAGNKERELEESKLKVESLHSQLKCLKCEIDSIVPEMTNKIQELQSKLDSSTQNGMAKDKELEKASELINELQTQLTSTGGDSAIVSDLSNQVATLNQKLKEWTVYAGNKERELEESKLKVESLHSQLKCLKCEIDSIMPDMTNKIQELQSNLDSSTQNGMAKDKELEKASELIDELQTQLTSSSGDSAIISDLSNQVATLNQKLKEWTVHAGNKERELEESKLKVGSLHSQLKCLKCEIDSVVPEMTNEIQGLPSNFDSSTVYGLVKDKELEKSKELANEPQTQLKCLRKVEGNFCDVDRNTYDMRENVYLASEEELLVEPLIPELSVAEELNPESIFTDDTDSINQSSKHLHQSEIFKTDDPIVEASRDILMAQRFGWIRFNSKKNCRAWPGFVYPPDEEGLSQAQQILPDGYVTDTKKTFFHFDENIPEEDKGKIQVRALKKFNEKFKFNFV